MKRFKITLNILIIVLLSTLGSCFYKVNHFIPSTFYETLVQECELLDFQCESIDELLEEYNLTYESTIGITSRLSILIHDMPFNTSYDSLIERILSVDTPIIFERTQVNRDPIEVTINLSEATPSKYWLSYHRGEMILQFEAPSLIYAFFRDQQIHIYGDRNLNDHIISLDFDE